MERKMRRFRQQLPDDEARRILADTTNGILSLVDTDGTPYGVPLSYVYDGDHTIYMHSARSGRKIDCLRRNPAASFCVVVRDDILPEQFTTLFVSVIASGTVTIIDDEAETVRGLRMLADKYSLGIDSTHEITTQMRNVLTLRMDIEAITGKESIELTRERPAK